MIHIGPMTEDHAHGRVGFAAIVGRPNVGKSTLLNRVLGQKIAIVSRRPQTTRNRILGVRTQGPDQLILVDTPGIHRSRANLNRFMVREALEGLQGVDCIILITEAGGDTMSAGLHAEDRYVLDQLHTQQIQSPMVLAINKIDLHRDRKVLLPLIDAWQEKKMEAIVPISALNGDNVDALLREVTARLPRGPRLYPEEMITDRAERFLASELIREQIFERCHKEIPYSTAVQIVQFLERTDRNDIHIEAIVHVERESQKAIIIGKGGAMIKAIGTSVRHELSRLLGCPVHVKLIAHVEPQWSRTPKGRRKLGYE